MIIIDNLFSADEVGAFLAVTAKLDWIDGSVSAMGMAAAVKRNRQADASAPGTIELANRLLAKLGSHPRFVSAALPQKIFPPCFNEYSGGGQYGFHVDAAIMRLPNSNEVLRSDLSLTVFLSCPETYEGGELIIETDFGEQCIKLPAGSAVLYPSSSLHRVTPVTRGRRVAAISWIQSMVSDQSMRATLYDLDQTIQSLGSNDSVARTELDALHLVYHNLVRQHAQL